MATKFGIFVDDNYYKLPTLFWLPKYQKDYINHVLLLILVFWHLECLNMISLLSILHYLV